MTSLAPETDLHTADPREILAYLPYRIGYRLRDCVVAVGLRPRRHLGLVARVDTADLLSARGDATARAVAGHLREDGSPQALVVIYTPRDPRREHDGLRLDLTHPAARAAAVLRAERSALSVAGVWVVTETGYLALDCADAACCPAGGRPLADLETTEVAARLVLSGSVVADTRAQVGSIPPAPARSRRATAAARLRWADAYLRASAQSATLRSWRHRSFTAWQRAVRLPEAAGTAQFGRIEAAFEDRIVRDAILLSVITSADPHSRLPGVGGLVGDELARAVLDLADGMALAGADADGLDPGARPAPEPVPGGQDEELAPVAPPGSFAQLGPADLGATIHTRLRRATSLVGPAAAAASVGLLEVKAAHAEPDGTPGGPIAGVQGVDRAVRAAVAGLLSPHAARRPDTSTLNRATELLERLIAHGRRDRQPAAVTLLALLAWWQGEGVRASVLLDRAVADDPDYTLARQLERALALGVPPAWMRGR